MPFQLRDNLIRVPVTVNGRSAEAVLDSGTGALGLDRSFALSLGLQPGSASGMVAGGGKPEAAFPVKIAQLQFGPEQLKDASGLALDMSHLSSSAGFPFDVLLGFPVFERQAFRIDYPKRQIVFLAKGREAPCSDPIPLSFAGDTPVAAVTLRTGPNAPPVTLHLIVDLGTRHYAVMLGGPFLDTPEGQTLQNAGKPMQVGTGTGGPVEGSSVQLESLSIGKHNFPNLTVALTHQVGAFAKGIADGSLGVPLWKSGVITFDYPHHRLCLNIPQG